MSIHGAFRAAARHRVRLDTSEGLGEIKKRIALFLPSDSVFTQRTRERIARVWKGSNGFVGSSEGTRK